MLVKMKSLPVEKKTSFQMTIIVKENRQFEKNCLKNKAEGNIKMCSGL